MCRSSPSLALSSRSSCRTSWSVARRACPWRSSQLLTQGSVQCHKFVTVPFGPQINFLVGNNGSGKSAVLTGITMALGGAAKNTVRMPSALCQKESSHIVQNRAAKGSGFVREGAK